MWWQRDWLALVAVWIIFLLHRLANGETVSFDIAVKNENSNRVDEVFNFEIVNEEGKFGDEKLKNAANNVEFSINRGGIERNEYDRKRTRYPSHVKSYSNINKDDEGTLILRNLKEKLKESKVRIRRSTETDKEREIFSIRGWGQQKLKDKSSRVKKTRMPVNIVKNRSLRCSYKKLQKAGNSSEKANVVKVYSADGQSTTTTMKSFNESNVETWISRTNVKSELSEKTISLKNSRQLISKKNMKVVTNSDRDETPRCIVDKKKFNKKLSIGLSAVKYAGFIQEESSDSNTERNSISKYKPGETYRGTDVGEDMRHGGDAHVAVANELVYSESGFEAADIPQISVLNEIVLPSVISVKKNNRIRIPMRSGNRKTRGIFKAPNFIDDKLYELHSKYINPVEETDGISISDVGERTLIKSNVISSVSEGRIIYEERKVISENDDDDEMKTTLDINAEEVGKNSLTYEADELNEREREDVELENSSTESNALEELYERRNLTDVSKGGENLAEIRIPESLGNRSDADVEITRSTYELESHTRPSTPIEYIEDEERTAIYVAGTENEDRKKHDTTKAVQKITGITSTLQHLQKGDTGGLSLTVNLFAGDEKNETREPSKTNLSDKLWRDSEPKVVNLSALDIPGGEYELGLPSGRDLEKEKKNNHQIKLSAEILARLKVVGEVKPPVKFDNRRKFADGKKTGKFFIAKPGDKYLTTKNKRDMISSRVKTISLSKENENYGEKLSTTTVSSVSDSAHNDSEARNLSWQKIFTLVNKSETSTPTFGSISGDGETLENTTRLFLRSFSSQRDEEEEKEEEEEESVTISLKSSGRSNGLSDENEELISFRNDLWRSNNSRESDILMYDKKGDINESYSNYGNDAIENILKALEPLNEDSMDRDRLSTFVENLISTEKPLITTLDIFEAINHSINPAITTNQTDSDNTSRISTASPQWPVKHSAVVEGDLVLGGLMMVHEREDSVTCGPIMPQGGVQALEAMLYTLDRLNREPSIIPGVKIGAHILDDCDKDTYGLEMAVDFIKGSISNIDGAEYHCNKTAVRKVISGVVGAPSSVTSIQVANLLRLFRIPQVSFFSTSPELSNKQRFEYFTRTIPSDHYQVKAMVDIVRKLRWSYVSIIYEESNYGIKAFEELEELLAKYDICIAIKEKLVKDSGVAEETAYDNIVQKLLTKPRARGCIVFGSDQEVAGVMRAVRRCNATGSFSWIGSDGWSARGLVSDGNEPEVEGTLSVQPQANPVKGFEEYFLDLTVENNQRNPWFVEFWEAHFQCRYPNASWTPYNEKYTKPCTTKERLTKQNTAFEGQLQFVSDAVTAFAYAFRDMHEDLCHGKPGLCDAMKPTKGTELLKYLRKVHFEGLSGDEFRFDKNGDGPARYNIIHFKQVSPGQYKWLRVGEYMEGELRLNMSEIQFRSGHPLHPESVCSLPCEVGQAKKYVEGESCCWHCFNCTQYQVRHPRDETQCIPCPQGTVPDETHCNCSDIPEEFLRLESGWAIGAMSFSATGILVTLFVGGVFLRHNDTPVVRASGRELSYVLLTGILLCYLVTFALVLRPNNIVCGIQRFGAGFCFTVVYAALLTKTNRISRIFNAGKQSAKRPSFISPKSQLIICSGLMGVQILINAVWMIIDPAKAMHHYPTREDNLLVCNSYIDASYMIAFTYPIILIVVCTVYAVLTRKIPEAFNESKHIGFTMYTTCVIWLAFVPLYFGTGNHVALRITSMSVTISLSASVTIACLFSPKLYIILIRPERNVRQSLMPGRFNTTRSSAVTGTNASSAMAALHVTVVTCDQNKAVERHVTTTIDCSTQSDHYEMELKEDRINGKPPISLITSSTQTQVVESESNSAARGAVLLCDKGIIKDSTNNQRGNQLSNLRIGNGPMSHKDAGL